MHGGLGFSEPEPHKALAWIPWRVTQLLGRMWLKRQGALPLWAALLVLSPVPLGGGGARVDGQEVAPWWGTGPVLPSDASAPLPILLFFTTYTLKAFGVRF